MLQLKNIYKNYAEGDHAVRALQDVSLSFRKNEFVSIMGPSGCGKTTMLNIIGGLDQYTKGDLVIGGRSTKDFKDRDWDAYRNHSIGFVFQSYHLIPHQSVLQNVELALSLSGVSKRECRRRAKEALERVGLGDQLRKRPGQMSGGQMQRVAIARALVNDPEIILADEPTGALDTETSVQVMDLLKEVAKDRLVIMVTHNPDLAEKYSTRIIRMLDGKITHDSAPLTQEELEAMEQEKPAAPAKKERKPSMRLSTSFGLSLKNLFTKKGRTLLTAFAGSIGIIGIALIASVSQGTTDYIDAVQEDALSSYPLTLQATTVDLGTLLQTFSETGSQTQTHELDGVYSQSMMFEMINALNNLESTENDLASFKTYLEQEMTGEGILSNALSGVQYSYDLDLQVYTKNVDGQIIRSDTQEMMMEAIGENMGADMSSMMAMEENMGASMGITMSYPGMTLWSELLSDKQGGLISPLIQEQYDLIEGRWPERYDEILLVVDQNNELQDVTLYALGLKSQEEIDAVFDAVQNGGQLDTTQQRWSYEEIMAMEFRVVPNSDCYLYNSESGLYVDQRTTQTGLKYLYDSDKAIPLKVTGILRPNPDVSSHMIAGSIAYTKALTQEIVERMAESPAIKAQLESPDRDVTSGLPFRPLEGAMTEEEKETLFREYVASLTAQEQITLYWKMQCIPTLAELQGVLANTPEEQMRAQLLSVFVEQMGTTQTQAQEYLDAMSLEDVQVYYGQVAAELLGAQKTAMVAQTMQTVDPVTVPVLLAQLMESCDSAQCADYYDQVLEFSQTTLEENLVTLGQVDLESPMTINLYASSFEKKEDIEAAIGAYNASVEELKQIRYTDYVGIMMSSVTTIIDAITYVLIAFVSISLVVSSIMIGVITLISVQERTKEIGILRAIGASKRNVSSMFNAETAIIGLGAGLLGVVVTWLLCFPINWILRTVTGIAILRARLPLAVAVALVIISVVLTLISGIIPSRSAARKDPVVALRTE